jgi:hypothetical protein
MKIYDLLLIHLSVLIKFSTGIMHDDYMTPVLQITHVLPGWAVLITQVH